MKLQRKAMVVLVSLAIAPLVASGAEIDTLGAMRQTGVAVDWQPIPQTGPKADQVKHRRR